MVGIVLTAAVGSIAAATPQQVREREGGRAFLRGRTDRKSVV